MTKCCTGTEKSDRVPLQFPLNKWRRGGGGVWILISHSTACVDERGGESDFKCHLPLLGESHFCTQEQNQVSFGLVRRRPEN